MLHAEATIHSEATRRAGATGGAADIGIVAFYMDNYALIPTTKNKSTTICVNLYTGGPPRSPGDNAYSF